MRGNILLGLVAGGLVLSSQLALADRYDGGRYDSGRYDSGRYDSGRYSGGSIAVEYDYARVVAVEPLVERYRVAEPVQQCWNETQYDEGRVVAGGDRSGATLLGGLLGAVVGNRFGHGSDRRVATVAGAVLGGAIGNQVAASRDDGYGYRYREEPRAYEVERCATRHDVRYSERVVGYRVTYSYNGREHTTRLPYDPGRRIRVAVHPE